MHYLNTNRVTFHHYAAVKVVDNKQKGSFIGYVTSDNPSAYPDDDIQDGYWYVKQT